MNADSYTLLRRIQSHDLDRAMFQLSPKAHPVTFRECVSGAGRFGRAMEQIVGLTEGGVLSALPAGPDLVSLMLACWAKKLPLTLIDPASLDRLASHTVSKFRLLVTDGASTDQRLPVIKAADLHQGNGGDGEILAELGGRAELSVFEEGAVVSLGEEALARSVDNFAALCPTRPGDVLASGSDPFTLAGAFVCTIMPLALGLTVRLVSRQEGDRVARTAAFEGVDLCELPASDWSRLAREPFAALPSRLRRLICGSATLDAEAAGAVERAVGRRVERGFGTSETGLWAVPLGRPASTPKRFEADIRPLRSPLHLVGATGTSGEVILREGGCEAEQDIGLGAEPRRTGLVGWVDAHGGLEIAGRLSEVVVRAGQAFLLSDHDRLLEAEGVPSRTFREAGKSPTDRAICVLLASDTASSAGESGMSSDTERAARIDRAPGLERTTQTSGDALGAADALRRVAAAFAGAIPVVDHVVAVSGCDRLPRVDVLRSVASGSAARAVLAALTARRFRRNPAYDEAGLAAAVDRALLGNGRLDFLMFWGCGPRRHAAAPDQAAIDALRDLLAAAEGAAPLRARARVICTDLHATNNGHSDLHYLTYFSEIAGLAQGMDAEFERESAVWARGGLSRSDVLALEQTPDFAERWARFALRDRFIHQAEKHSRRPDKVAAARHYFATCLKERVVLKRMFPNSVFLTYNGPDFNECFPDLPTLYVYPGPRGPNDKPWFVDLPAAERDPGQVAAA